MLILPGKLFMHPEKLLSLADLTGFMRAAVHQASCVDWDLGRLETFGNLSGLYFTRTTTLAGGADGCDFRFKKGGPTNVAVPAALQNVVARRKS